MPAAAVGRRAAADAEDDPADAGVERRLEQLAGPDGSSPGSDRARPARTRDRPDASAISTTARCPSSERSQPALIAEPERVP